MLFTKKTQIIVKNITWLELSKRSTGCIRQYLWRDHSILLSVTHMLCINQVCHSAQCQSLCKRRELFFVKAGVRVNGQFLMGYLTISTNVRRYKTHHITTFSFRKTAHRCILCVTQSNWVKMWFSRFRVLPGSAEAHVTWGGIVKCLLTAYFISNISAKKYQNPFMCVKVIASQRWDVFRDKV